MPIALDEIAALIEAGEVDRAAKQLESAPRSDSDVPRRLLLKALIEERRGNIEEALIQYEEALDEHPADTHLAFRAARLHDLRGNDEDAIDLYERCVHNGPAPVNALLNLAVLCEEDGRYEEARSYIESVLNEFPMHARALLFENDLLATLNMVYDDDDPHRRTDRNSLFDMPLSEFELSVRSRNCLRQMNIHTLGDLLRMTEPELMSYKNFGETSLNEIKAVLSARSLAIGQLAAAVEPSRQASYVEAQAPVGDPALLAQSVSTLELSVRARRCLQRLGVTALNDLVQRTEAELLATKNFGQTSLDEIRCELTQRGLKLRSVR